MGKAVLAMGMQNLRIRVINSKFVTVLHSMSERDPDLALAEGQEGAIGIAADEVRAGASSSAVQVAVEQEDGTPLRAVVVTLSVSRLAVEAEEKDVEPTYI